jgi:hypothetical protein
MFESEIFGVFISESFYCDYTSDLIFSLFLSELYSAFSLFPSFGVLLFDSGLILETLVAMDTNDLSKAQKLLALLHDVLRYYKL